MSVNRRRFLKTTAAAGGALSLGAASLALASTESTADAPAAASADTDSIEGSLAASSAEPVPASDESRHPLRILILGGTSFIGPHLIHYALQRGHSVTTFTRGKTKPAIHQQLFRHVEQLTGDRIDNLEALKGRFWDAVIDNSGQRVEWTRDSAQLLKDSAENYIYTSSTGVYYPYLGTDIREDTDLVLEVPDGLNRVQQMEYGYGVMKSLSEIEARKAFGEDRAIIVRPTYIAGPADTSNRFPYWPVRLAIGGEVMVPGKGHDPIQYIDVRDLAGFMIRLLENRQAGTYNAAGPASELGMHPFVFGVHAAVSSAVSWINIPDYDFLFEHGVEYSVPWIPPVGDNLGSARTNIEHSVSNGLTFRPLAVTVHDILEWWHSEAVTQERRDRLIRDPESLMAREPGVIEGWEGRKRE